MNQAFDQMRSIVLDEYDKKQRKGTYSETQEEYVERILRSSGYKYGMTDAEKEVQGYLRVEQLRDEMGIKNPELIIKRLLARGVIRVDDSKIALETAQVFCRVCHKSGRSQLVYEWDRVEHLKSYHHYNDEHIPSDIGVLFSSKELAPLKEHEYEFVSFDDRMVILRCKHCNEEQHLYPDRRDDCLGYEDKRL